MLACLAHAQTSNCYYIGHKDTTYEMAKIKSRPIFTKNKSNKYRTRLRVGWGGENESR